MFVYSAQPIANLSTFKLRELSDKIEHLLGNGGRTVDPYTIAHLSEAKVRITKSLDADYIYNTDDMGGGGGLPFMFFQPNSDK